jgi:hypothetical protein
MIKNRHFLVTGECMRDERAREEITRSSIPASSDGPGAYE